MNLTAAMLAGLRSLTTIRGPEPERLALVPASAVPPDDDPPDDASTQRA